MAEHSCPACSLHFRALYALAWNAANAAEAGRADPKRAARKMAELRQYLMETEQLVNEHFAATVPI